MERKILIVDDNDTNVSVLRELLSDDYTLEAAGSGEECLAILEEFNADLVLLDIMMPGIDGYETCRQIKAAADSQMPQVILVSARASTEERLRGYRVGADDYITKPFEHDELLAKVRIQFRLLESLKNLAAAHSQLAAINNDLDEMVHRQTAEVIATRDVAVFALAKLAESRDQETGEHLERMRAYAQIIAQHLSREGPYTDQIDKQFLEDIYRSSPLHDVGKVGIPDVILLKPGRLSSAEFEIMKQHAVIGAEAIESAVRHTGSGGFLHMAADIARSHHERFDGTGYPDGLVGDAIPLSARIVALADVYDALSSSRVYKKAIEPIVVRAMIEEQPGKHFDPVIVDAFRACWDRFLLVPEQGISGAGSQLLRSLQPMAVM